MLLFENLKKVNREKNTPKKKTTEKPLQVARPTNEENKQINSPVAAATEVRPTPSQCELIIHDTEGLTVIRTKNPLLTFI